MAVWVILGGVWCAAVVSVGDDVTGRGVVGGGGEIRSKQQEKTTSGSLLHAREVVLAAHCRNVKKKSAIYTLVAS